MTQPKVEENHLDLEQRDMVFLYFLTCGLTLEIGLCPGVSEALHALQTTPTQLQPGSMSSLHGSQGQYLDWLGFLAV